MLQGLFLADFIAVIGLYSQSQKVSFIFPTFGGKFPISISFLKKNHHFYHGKSWLKTAEYSTLHSLISCNGDYKLTLQLNSDKYMIYFYNLTIQLKAQKNPNF